MIDFTSIPTSTAQQLYENNFFNIKYKFTYTGSIDEKKLYHAISTRLIALETSLDINRAELEAINNMAKEFQTITDEKDEVLLRIDWLHRLYQTKEEIGFVDTKEKAKYLSRLLAHVQTCPLKKQLMVELDLLEQTLPEEKIAVIVPSINEQIMERAIEEIGELFINLGKVGREFVITSVLEKFGDNANVDNVKESAFSIEQRVSVLSKVTDPAELIASLEQLPLQSFVDLNNDRKEEVAKRLFEQNKWNGLAALDRRIIQLVRAISIDDRKQEVAENNIQTKDGNAVLTLNIENTIEGIIKVG